MRRLAQIKEAILVAWGITREGRKVLIFLSLGNKESYSDWLEFLRDMVKRGLRTPLSITSDGAPGVAQSNSGDIPQDYPDQVLVYKMENLPSKVPPLSGLS